MGVAIVGCGNIARAYVEDLRKYPEIRLLGFSDLDPKRARAFAGEYGGRAYSSIDEVLSDSEVELVVNLTIHHAHEEVIDRCLDAGRHVHTEKPLALSAAAARRLTEKAVSLGLRLSSAPTTWMGGPQQATARLLRSGRIGRVRLAYAEINHGRIETWHPNPEPFYDVGVLWDVGIYPVTLLTAFLGPVCCVSSQQKLLLPDRVTKEGKPFSVTRPDYIQALLTFTSGTQARLTCNFYTVGSKQGSSIEFHGDSGSLVLESAFKFNSTVDHADYGEPLKPIEEEIPRRDKVEFALGVRELAQAIAGGRPHRASAEQAAHVIEVMEAIDRSAAADGATQAVESKFPLPELF